jgi:hypothetical protein
MLTGQCRSFLATSWKTDEEKNTIPSHRSFHSPTRQDLFYAQATFAILRFQRFKELLCQTNILAEEFRLVEE